MKRLIMIGGPYGAGKTGAMLKTLGQDIVRGKFVDPQKCYENLQEYYAIETYKGEETRDFVTRAFERAFSERFEQMRTHKSLTAICSLGAIEDLDLLDAGRRNGFHIALYFFGVQDWRSCEQHIRETEGHWLSNLSSKEIYGDYHRALAMLPGAIIQADKGMIYDNSDRENPRPLLAIEDGKIQIIETNLPDWILEPLSRCL